MSQELHKDAPQKHFYYARENRKTETETERILWEALRDRKLHGFKFRRQHPISDFIADFYCHECRLIVELDGKYHNVKEQIQYDNGRTYELNELKIKVMRFTNEEVVKNLEHVVGEIGTYLLAYPM